jgi:hypothetical protein
MIFYCYHDNKTHKKWINASPNGAGGLASRKPQKNKGSKKATLKTIIHSSSFVSSFPILRMKSPCQDGTERRITVG